MNADVFHIYGTLKYYLTALLSKQRFKYHNGTNTVRYKLCICCIFSFYNSSDVWQNVGFFNLISTETDRFR